MPVYSTCIAPFEIPTQRFLVQQHVHACLGGVQSMQSSLRTRNCTLFPLYVAGARAVTTHHREWVLEALNAIHSNLWFESVLPIRETLQQKWRLFEVAPHGQIPSKTPLYTHCSFEKRTAVVKSQVCYSTRASTSISICIPSISSFDISIQVHTGR